MIRLSFHSILIGILTMMHFYSYAQSTHQHCKKHRKFLPSVYKADNSRSDTLDLNHIHLNLDLTQMDNNEIHGIATILLESKLNGVSELNFDLLGLTVDSVKSDDLLLDFSHNDELLKIFSANVLEQGDVLELEIYYGGSPQMDQSGWGGFYFQGDYAFNLGVGFDADPHTFGRAWFPCFDNFVERNTYSFDVLVDNGRSAYCNGILTNIEDLGGDSLIYSWSLEQPIPSYLTSVAVSHYTSAISSFESIQGVEIPIYLTAQAQDTANAKASFVELNLCLTTFENRFGPYRWDRVGYAFVPFSGGAMEHATNISYPLFAADGTTAFNTLMAHELSHHWWGDLITCRTQEDMWLNEGMASFSEFLFIEALDGAAAYVDLVKQNHKDVVLHAHEDDGERLPVSGIGHENTYGSHVYNKGADMAYNLREYMGDEEFFAGTTSFLEEFAFQDVSSNDLMIHLNDFGDSDLESFFNNWIYEPGWCAMSLDSFLVIAVGNEYEISVFTHQQLHYAPALFENVPVTYTAIDAEGNRESFSLVMTSQNSTATFTSSIEPVHLVVNLENELSMAMFTEELTIGATGYEPFNYAEFMVNIETIEPGDSLWVVVQNYWVSADEDQEQIEFHIADDRFWRIDGNFSENIEASGRIRYFGNDQSGSYFDPIFFAEMASQGLTEDSLILVMRNSTADPWMEHESYSLNVQGNATNWQGLIDFDHLRKGDYAWAYRTGMVGIGTKKSEIQIFPNPAMNYTSMSGFSIGTEYHIIDANGTIVHQGTTLHRSEQIDCSAWSAGTYTILIDGHAYRLIKI